MNIPEKLRSITASLSERSRERKRLRGPADLNYAIADSIDTCCFCRNEWKPIRPKPTERSRIAA